MSRPSDEEIEKARVAQLEALKEARKNDGPSPILSGIADRIQNTLKNLEGILPHGGERLVLAKVYLNEALDLINAANADVAPGSKEKEGA